ncbi:hypothetical protein HPB48_011876 [Haemaphysalis longicornis]|uniref:Uncharacterized protein n=1 Tax=Haemaphysalis longicornis TaxID=44386 RepID=A0A9J6FMD0_HAELO|nr:hypothetical protein HPB48_011876 [Haemaphysalis longicornis]
MSTTGRGAKPSKSEPLSSCKQPKEKKSTSRIVPAPNLPAFAYKDANPSRHISHVVASQSRQGSVEDLAAEKTNERSHSRLSQRPAATQGPRGQLWVWLATASVLLLLIAVFAIVFALLKGSSGRTSTTAKS